MFPGDSGAFTSAGAEALRSLETWLACRDPLKHWQQEPRDKNDKDGQARLEGGGFFQISWPELHCWGSKATRDRALNISKATGVQTSTGSRAQGSKYPKS